MILKAKKQLAAVFDILPHSDKFLKCKIGCSIHDVTPLHVKF